MKRSLIYKLIAESAADVVENHKRLPNLYPVNVQIERLMGMRTVAFYSFGENNPAYKAIEAAFKELNV
jgi:hypothetical protein